MILQNKQTIYFPRGSSLEKDFRELINDERFFDITLKCSDETIHGCKAILATRSDVFNELIFSESENNSNLSFNDINSAAMKVILEFLYTSKVEKFTVKNIVETYYASIHFKLVDLQDLVIEFTKKSLIDGNADVAKKLLSECVEKFSLKMNNKMSRNLVYWVAKNKLEKNKSDSLSLEGLRYLLEKTFDTQIPFATPEFNIWEYTLIKATRKVIQSETLVKKISNENSLSTCDRKEIEGIKSHLIPFISCIELNRMDAKEIKKHVEPFNVFSIEKVNDVYYSKTQNKGLGFIRGAPIFRWKNDEIDKQVIVSDDGFIIEIIKKPTQIKSILGDLIFKGEGVYEWNILIKKLCGIVYIGICDINEDFNKPDQKYHGWVLGSDGYVYDHKNEYKWYGYDARFKEGDKVTVHLDMRMKTCAFSINRIRKTIVTEWKDIPSQVYPIVSFLEHGSKLRIEPHTSLISSFNH